MTVHEMFPGEEDPGDDSNDPSAIFGRLALSKVRLEAARCAMNHVDEQQTLAEVRLAYAYFRRNPL